MQTFGERLSSFSVISWQWALARISMASLLKKQPKPDIQKEAS